MDEKVKNEFGRYINITFSDDSALRNDVVHNINYFENEEKLEKDREICGKVIWLLEKLHYEEINKFTFFPKSMVECLQERYDDSEEYGDQEESKNQLTN